MYQGNLNSNNDGGKYTVNNVNYDNSNNLQYNINNVPISLLTPRINSSIFENAGIYHNQILNTLITIEGGTHTVSQSSIANSSGHTIYNDAMNSEQKQIFPPGSARILQSVMDDFWSAPDIESCINVFKTAFEKYRLNSAYKDTMLIAVLSVGYYSSLYWTSAISFNEESNMNGNYIVNKYINNNTHHIAAAPRWLNNLVNNVVNWLNNHKVVIGADVLGFYAGMGAGTLAGPISGIICAAVASWAVPSPSSPIFPQGTIINNILSSFTS